jgi:hypothetical protein
MDIKILAFAKPAKPGKIWAVIFSKIWLFLLLVRKWLIIYLLSQLISCSLLSRSKRSISSKIARRIGDARRVNYLQYSIFCNYVFYIFQFHVKSFIGEFEHYSLLNFAWVPRTIFRWASGVLV